MEKRKEGRRVVLFWKVGGGCLFDYHGQGGGRLFLWGRLLKPECLSEEYSLSIRHQRFPLFSSSLPGLIFRVWSRCGPKRYKTWGFQFKACLVIIPRCFFPAWPVHLHFVRPICIWMGALPDISHRTPFVPVSVHVTFTFLRVHELKDVNGIIQEWMHEK